MMTTFLRARRLLLPLSPLALAVLTLAVIMPLSLRADYLKNTDLLEGMAGWHGDADVAFLKPDGTEGQEGDPGAIPVIRIVLSRGQVHSVYQDYETRDKPRTQHIRVEVFASKDFKRSKFPSDYSSEINWKPGGVWYWSEECVPNVDFWIRGAPGFIYKLADLKPGKWVTVDGKWDSPPQAEDRTVCFMVPPGEGTIYLKNPSASP